MPKRLTDKKFQIEFAIRLRQARLSAGYKRIPEFARALGVEQNSYRRYELTDPKETRIFPLGLLPRVVELTGHGSWYLLTGQPDRKEPSKM